MSATGKTTPASSDVASRAAKLNGITHAYAYDSADRLLTITSEDDTPAEFSGFSCTLDAAGNRTQVVDNSGTHSHVLDDLHRITSVTYTYEYDIYGEVTTHSGSDADYFLFAGEQRDDDAGLYFLRARYYDPATGRFISRDPIEFGQRYADAGNNPVLLVDPMGLCGWLEPWDCGVDLITTAAGAANRTAHAVSPPSRPRRGTRRHRPRC